MRRIPLMIAFGLTLAIGVNGYALAQGTTSPGTTSSGTTGSGTTGGVTATTPLSSSDRPTVLPRDDHTDYGWIGLLGLAGLAGLLPKRRVVTPVQSTTTTR